jgi:hypothetical protein
MIEVELKIDKQKEKLIYKIKDNIYYYIHFDLSKYMQDKAVDITILFLFFNSHEVKIK